MRTPTSSQAARVDEAPTSPVADEATYAGYDAHPAHRAFVAERWLPEVAEFLEIDYTPL